MIYGICGCLLAALCIVGYFATKWRTELTRLQHFVALQREITQVLERAGSMEGVAIELLKLLCPWSHSQVACVYIVDRRSGLMRCLATLADSNDYDDFLQVCSKMVCPPDLSPRASGRDGKAVVLLADLSKEQTFARAAAAHLSGLKSAIIIPLMKNDEPLGAIELYGTDYRPHSYVQEGLERMSIRLAYFILREDFHQQVAASENELRAVIDTAPDGIVYVDNTGLVQSVNKAVVSLLGYTREEMVGNNVVNFLPDLYKERFGSALKYYFHVSIESLIGRATEVVGQRKDGTTFPMELTVGRLSVADREIFIGIMRDISDRKSMEKRVSEFYSIISHELRSPLASIRGSLGLLDGGVIGHVSDDALELVQIAKKNCDRLIRLINDILDAKKIEAGKLYVVPQVISPDEIILLAMEGLQSFAAESRVSMVCEATQSPAVIGDEDRIVQVLTNLLSNAIKYSEVGGQVDVFTSPAVNGDSFVRFSVRDRGRGVPSDQLAKLFSEFQQLDSSDTRAKGGTGLGLAISKSIVEQLGGQIGVDNCPGQGATFWFELPLAEPAGVITRENIN